MTQIEMLQIKFSGVQILAKCNGLRCLCSRECALINFVLISDIKQSVITVCPIGPGIDPIGINRIKKRSYAYKSVTEPEV